MGLTKNEVTKNCGLKKPLFDDLTVMCVRSFQLFADTHSLADISLFQTYFAGFVAGSVGILSFDDAYKLCRECECDRKCDNCDIALKMRVHLVATALREEFNRKMKEEFTSEKDVDIQNKIL